jgi:hypothetical protein
VVVVVVVVVMMTSFRFLLSGSQQLAFWTWKDSETYYKDAFDC